MMQHLHCILAATPGMKQHDKDPNVRTRPLNEITIYFILFVHHPRVTHHSYSLMTADNVFLSYPVIF